MIELAGPCARKHQVVHPVGRNLRFEPRCGVGNDELDPLIGDLVSSDARELRIHLDCNKVRCGRHPLQEMEGAESCARAELQEPPARL